MTNNSNLSVNVNAELPAKEIYEDTLQPATKVTGGSLRDIASLADALLAPIRISTKVLNKLEGYLGYVVDKKLSKIPDGKLIEPDSLVAGPLIQNVIFALDHNHIKEMYANLLKQAMSIDSKDKALPCYVDIIKQLSPIDAFVIDSLKNNLSAMTAIVDLKKKIGSDSFEYLYIKLTPFKHELYKTNDFTISIENLIRLNILDIPPYASLSNSSAYSWVKSTPEYSYLSRQAKIEGFYIEIEEQVFKITEFGKSFISICCLD